MKTMKWIPLISCLASFTAFGVSSEVSLQRGTISGINLEAQTLKIEGKTYLLADPMVVVNHDAFPSNLRGLKKGQFIEYNLSTDPALKSYSSNPADLAKIDYIKIISKPNSSDKGE